MSAPNCTDYPIDSFLWYPHGHRTVVSTTQVGKSLPIHIMESSPSLAAKTTDPFGVPQHQAVKKKKKKNKDRKANSARLVKLPSQLGPTYLDDTSKLLTPGGQHYTNMVSAMNRTNFNFRPSLDVSALGGSQSTYLWPRGSLCNANKPLTMDIDRDARVCTMLVFAPWQWQWQTVPVIYHQVKYVPLQETSTREKLEVIPS
jgi:hypothetical protein